MGSSGETPIIFGTTWLGQKHNGMCAQGRVGIPFWGVYGSYAGTDPCPAGRPMALQIGGSGAIEIVKYAGGATITNVRVYGPGTIRMLPATSAFIAGGGLLEGLNVKGTVTVGAWLRPSPTLSGVYITGSPGILGDGYWCAIADEASTFAGEKPIRSIVLPWRM